MPPSTPSPPLEPDPETAGDPEDAEVSMPPGEVRRLRWRTLTLLWCAVSMGAVLLWVREQSWMAGPGLWARVKAVRLEQWVALVLLGLHGGFAWAWLRARRDGEEGGR